MSTDIIAKALLRYSWPRMRKIIDPNAPGSASILECCRAIGHDCIPFMATLDGNRISIYLEELKPAVLHSLVAYGESVKAYLYKVKRYADTRTLMSAKYITEAWYNEFVRKTEGMELETQFLNYTTNLNNFERSIQDSVKGGYFVMACPYTLPGFNGTPDKDVNFNVGVWGYAVKLYPKGTK